MKLCRIKNQLEGEKNLKKRNSFGCGKYKDRLCKMAAALVLCG